MPNLLTLFDAKQWIKGTWHANKTMLDALGLPRSNGDSFSYGDTGDLPCNGMCAMGFIHTDLGGAMFNLDTDDFKFDPDNYEYNIPPRTSPTKRVEYFRNICRAVIEVVAGEAFDAWATTSEDVRIHGYSLEAQHGEESFKLMQFNGVRHDASEIIHFNDSDDTPEEDIRAFFQDLLDYQPYERLRRLARMPDEQLTLYAEGYLDSLPERAGGWSTHDHYKQLKRANVI